ncbi:unnamed protein product [Tilletia controversa]|uniref:Uncharacterized protein n=3 Tax=Tilletia TaxID=13289 RepID=A0A8X7MN89_9BASI|nr:hypothetical protein CF328_g6051 [Tilletia controversa]KAE8254148.1 hypothetical protein A4X03_0g5759 [Tilletia caries]CAD6963324.1 unnamed protein product [Tilletia laevis]KAE8242796.1 hypothetical protein A4X06_0g6757 [Tilletia controversa]CAD6893916.1 unnamed protein product [Tilletia caries]
MESAASILRVRRSSSVEHGSSGFFAPQSPTYGAAGSERQPVQRSGQGDLEANRRVEPISLEGTGLHIDEDHTLDLHGRVRTNDTDQTAVQQNGSSPTHPKEDLATETSDANRGSLGSPTGSQARAEQGSTHLRFNVADTSQGASSAVSRPPLAESGSANAVRTRSTQAASQKAGKSKTKASYPENLSQIIQENFDQEERKIFLALDSEIRRVIAFLEAREKQALDRFEVLALQLQELAQHRIQFKSHNQGSTVRKVASDAVLNLASSRMPKISSVVSALPARITSVDGRRGLVGGQEATERRGSGASATPVLSDPSQPGYWDEGAERRSLALSRIPHFTKGQLFTAADEEIRRANEAAALSHDPERYRSAKKKMKAAVLEEYRLLELIKDFRTLNRTALAKILKKLQKQTGVHCSDAFFKARVARSMLVKSEEIERLLKSTEELYTFFFEHGDSKKARERLRSGNAFATLSSSLPHQSHHISVFKAGIFLGVALCATVAGLVKAVEPATKLDIPQWPALMRVYGALFLPALFAFLFGLNLAAWRRTRVNYVFIFEFDVRTMADYHQYFELPALFLLMLSLCFWVTFLNPFPDKIAPTTWPLVWIVTVLVVLLMPVPFLSLPSRRWLVRSLLRVFQAGILSRVEFRDFFLGDELNSLVWSFATLWFIGCQYQRQWPAIDTCEPNGTFWTPVLGALPPFIRFIQCWRRWIDSDMKARIHLINAGKYTTSILNQFFYFNYRYHGSNRTRDLIVWCVFGCIYSIYTSAWDLKIDWGLLDPRARWPYLRNDLYYEWPFLYYFAIVSNVIIRFAWVIYLIPGPASSLMKIFIIALLEALRRWQWNMYRLENEHLGNADDFRVVKDVPLPYTHGIRVAEEDLDEDEGPSSKKQRRNIFKLSETFKRKDSDQHSDPFAEERMAPGAEGEGMSDRNSDALGPAPDEAPGLSSAPKNDDRDGGKKEVGREPQQGASATNTES